MYHGYIYLTLDQKTNKIYIGQKSGKIENSTNYYGSGLTIQQILNKRGNYFLKKFILGICYSKEELNLSEIECIWLFRSYGSDGIHHDNIYGYNLTLGGDGGNITGNHPNKENIYKKSVDAWYNKSDNEKQIIIEKRSIGQKKSYMEHPERCKNLSDSVIEFNKNNPEISKSKSDQMTQWYIDFPEEKVKRREESKERWKDPLYREKQAIKQKEWYENSIEERIQFGEKIKQIYIDNPEKRLEQSEKTKQRYIDHPEEREKQSIRFSGKNSSTYKEVDTLQILKLKTEGKTIVEISNILNISEGIISRRLKNPEKYL